MPSTTTNTPVVSAVDFGSSWIFGYEAATSSSSCQIFGCDDLTLPDVYFNVWDVLLAPAISRANLISQLSVEAEPIRRLSRGSVSKGRNAGQHRGLRAILRQRSTISPRQTAQTQLEVEAHFDETSYCKAVTAVKEHIFAGDIFEACLNHRLESPLDGGGPWTCMSNYGESIPLRACYLNFPEAQVVSASPERFLHLTTTILLKAAQLREPDRAAQALRGSTASSRTSPSQSKTMLKI